MRVIAGSARSLLLKTIDGQNVRPTNDRIKETLFNIINNRIYDSWFLDLFSGSGGIGLEALSRGAKKCYFVDNNKDAIKCIKENLQFTKLEENAVVIYNDVISSIREMEASGLVFSTVFIDPPYKMDIEKELLQALANSKIINEDTIIIVEALKDKDFSFLTSLGLKLTREKIYKSNKHVFINLDLEED